MTTLRKAAQQALEALHNCADGEDDVLLTRDALTALRAVLEQTDQEQEQELLAWMLKLEWAGRKALEQPEPVAWCLVYYDRRGGPIYSNPTMHYQSAEAMAVMSEGRVEVVGLCVETPRTKS